MIPAGVRIYVCTQSMDLRRSFDGLEIAVRQRLALDPRSGGLFVFFNRRADQLRALFWDRNGFCIFSKRLEGARFRVLDEVSDSPRIEIDGQRLMSLLDGVTATRGRKTRLVAVQQHPELATKE